MNRVAALAGMLRGRREGVERMEAVYLGFEPVGDHLLEAVRIGIEHHHGHGDAPFAQHHALVGESHGQVVHALVLEQLRHLEVARAVAPGLDHGHEARAERQLRPEIVQVVNHRIQIDLQHRGVALALQRVRQLLEAEAARPLQQDGAPRHIGPVDARDALVRRGEELLLAGGCGCRCRSACAPGPGRPCRPRGHTARRPYTRSARCPTARASSDAPAPPCGGSPGPGPAS